MAWIEERRRTDGQVSVRVKWRLGGGRGAPFQIETFSAGTDAQNRARAEGFKQMVDAAGQYWPEGWVRGQGFVRAREDTAWQPTPSFAAVGQKYVRQIVDLSPGQRKRYLAQVSTLADLEVRGVRVFDRPIDAVTEGDVQAWLIDWDRALKTKANYHGLLFGVFTYAVEEGYLSTNPCARTAPKRSRVRQSQAELRFLTEEELNAAVRLAGDDGDLLTFAVGTGLRFGEVTALWCSDIDLAHGTVRVNKAWKRDGEHGEGQTPGWLRKQVGSKHVMRQHHLGNPKTPKSRRTISISPALVELVRPRVERRLADDFVFTSPTGLALHNSDFYERVWLPLGAALKRAGIAPFRFHDLRHTHVAWLVAGGAPLPHIQARHHSTASQRRLRRHRQHELTGVPYDRLEQDPRWGGEVSEERAPENCGVVSVTDTLRDALAAASEETSETIVSAWAQTEELAPGDGGAPTEADLDQHLTFLRKLRDPAARAHGRGHRLYWYFRM